MLRVQVQLQTEFCKVEIIYLYNVQLEAWDQVAVEQCRALETRHFQPVVSVRSSGLL